MKIVAAVALCLFAYCSPANAALWKCPGKSATYERDLDSAAARLRKCVQLTHDQEWQADPIVAPAGPGPNPNWISLATDADKCKYFWDPATLSTKGKFRKAWFLQSCPDPSKLAGTSGTDKSQEVLLYFDCADQSYGSVQSVRYSDEYAHGTARGPLITKVTETEFIEPPPNSLGASWMILACTK